MTQQQLQDLLRTLLELGPEAEWIEYKTNMAKPEDIGEYISALSNAAALLGKEKAYVV